MGKTILHIIDTTGPGGAETVFTQLADETQVKGYNVMALIRGPGWVASELNRLGIETIVQNCKGSLNFKFLFFLRKLIRTRKIDLIQSHLLGSNVYASLAGLITGTPVVSTFHGMVDISNRERFFKFKMLAIKFGSRKVVAVTEQIREMLVKNKILNSNKVIVIANGIDTKHFAQKALSQPDLTSGIVIGCLGNVRRAKNYPLAIEVISLLKQQGYPIKLTIAGDDTNELASTCRAKAESLGVASSIDWLGFISDAHAYLAGLDIFLLCSESEGHPLALTQAMSVGLPIVATKCGIENILSNEVNALVVPNKDAGAIVAAIKRLVGDEVLRETLGNRAASQARESWSLQSTLKQYLDLYEFK